jgi:hypothetical protein
MNTTHTTHTHNTHNETETQHNMQTHTITLSGEQFQALATLTAITKTVDNVTPIIQKIAIETNGHTLTAYTTDRYRVAALTVETETDNGATKSPALVHWKDLAEFARAIKPGTREPHPVVTIKTTTDTRDPITGNYTHLVEQTLEADNGARRVCDSNRYHTATYPPVWRLLTEHRAKLDNAPPAKTLGLNPKYLADIAKLRGPGQTTRDAGDPWTFSTMSNDDGKPAPLLATREGTGWSFAYLLQPNLLPNR